MQNWVTWHASDTISAVFCNDSATDEDQRAIVLAVFGAMKLSRVGNWDRVVVVCFSFLLSHTRLLLRLSISGLVGSRDEQVH